MSDENMIYLDRTHKLLYYSGEDGCKYEFKGYYQHPMSHIIIEHEMEDEGFFSGGGYRHEEHYLDITYSGKDFTPDGERNTYKEHYKKYFYRGEPEVYYYDFN